ncbi:MAG: hypothetical protein Q8Q56_04050, partial [Alphaproteobacteria bacterium]|nr:hypothetical protein [Alphaproteobacteria bacterium]
MNSWKKLCWGLLLLGSLTIATAEPAASPKRRITLSLGYDENFNSNEGMKHLPLTSTQGYSWVFDQATKITEGEISRTALVIADIILHMPYLGENFNKYENNWLLKEKWWPYLPAYHEFGHARAMRAFCNEPFKGYDVQVARDPKKIDSVLWYYFHSIHHAGFTECAMTNGSFESQKYVQKLPIFAGGLNNEARLSSEIADWTYRLNGHIAYFGAYFRGKIAPVSYTTKTKSGLVDDDVSDIGHINKYYKSYYPGFNLDNIQYGGLVSLLCSSTTYSFLRGYWDFIKTGDTTVRTFTWNGVRLPDMNFYFTRNGLSLEFISGYQVNPNLWVNLGIETVYYPTKSIEFTPSVRYVLPTSIYGMFEFDAGVVINAYGHFSAHVGVEWTDPINPLTLHAKLIHHNANTYVGERNIPRALKGDHDVEIMISAS